MRLVPWLEVCLQQYKKNSDNRVHKLWHKCRFVVISPHPPEINVVNLQQNVVNLRTGREGQVSAQQH